LDVEEVLFPSKAIHGDPEDFKTRADGSSLVLNPYTLHPLGNCGFHVV